MSLRNCREPLIQQVLEAEVVDLDDELAQIRPPVPHGLQQADELLLVGWQSLVTQREGAAEVRDRALILMEHHDEFGAQRIAPHNKRAVEVQQGKDGHCGERLLEAAECILGLRRPHEPVFLQEARQGSRHRAELADEFPIVTREAQEAVQCPDEAGTWPINHGLHLGGVHGNAMAQHNVAQIGDRSIPKGALRPLEKELVGAERGKDGAKMLKVR